MAKRLTWYILVGMILGVVAGYAANLAIGPDAARAKEVASYFHLIADVFLHLIKMIIAPLVFSTLVAGIAHMGDSTALGRIGGRALLWFILASLMSLGLGLVLVNLFQPGVGLHLTPGAISTDINPKALDFHEFVLHIFPTSMIDAMATNNILQIVVFSVFIGVALTAIGEKGKPLVRGVEALVELMLQVTNYVMRAAPFAVFGAIAAVVTTQGLSILLTFGKFIGQFYFAMVCLWVLLSFAGFLFLGKKVVRLLRYIREPLLVGFATASSEAAYPKLLEQLDRFGVPRRISSFVLPLGYSFNLDGSMIYASFATIFIAQAYGIPLTLGTQITILLVLMITSKGIAGVPRASLVVIAATLAQFNLPVEGVALILGIDQFLDMGRTATNVVGNAVAASVIAKWEGMLEVEEPAEQEDLHAPSHTPAHGRAGLHLAEDIADAGSGRDA